jgi:hypothetical protein
MGKISGGKAMSGYFEAIHKCCECCGLSLIVISSLQKED